MASRAQLVEEVIRPGPGAGAVVVSDRYLLANIVYQGYAGGLGVERVSAGRPGGDGGALARPDARARRPPRRRPGRGSARRGTGSRTGPTTITRGSAKGSSGRPPSRRPVAARITPRRWSSSTPRAVPTPWPVGSEARWGVPWHSIRGVDRVVDELRGVLAQGRFPHALPVRRARGGRQADVRPQARPGLPLRALARGGPRPVRGVPRLPPGQGRAHTPTFGGRPARGQARAADQGDPRPLPRPRPQADARRAAGWRSSTTPTTSTTRPPTPS